MKGPSPEHVGVRVFWYTATCIECSTCPPVRAVVNRATSECVFDEVIHAQPGCKGRVILALAERTSDPKP